MAHIDAACALKGDHVWVGHVPYQVVGATDTFDHIKMGCRAITLTLEYKGEVLHKTFDCLYRLELCGISHQLEEGNL
jgi:DNA mismatch repair protein MutH